MKHIISTDLAPAAIGAYSQATSANGFVYTSGQLGIDAKTGVLAEGVAEQAKCSMQNIDAILAKAGLSLSDVVKTVIFLTDMNDFSAVNEVYASFFSGDYPARSCVAVAALPKGGLVEIECIAAK